MSFAVKLGYSVLKTPHVTLSRRQRFIKTACFHLP